jgi:hypothetical protein
VAVGLRTLSRPLHLLRKLTKLRLYGPSSYSMDPPPLALLLPQPGLLELKLSACASYANLRAMAAQSSLQKLILSHTAAQQLYPPEQARCPLPASVLGLHQEVRRGDGCQARRSLCCPAALRSPGQTSLRAGSLCCDAQPLPTACARTGPVQVSRGLTSLESLRIKDLPGFTDAHLADLACVLARLPSLRELKLRALGLLTDAGIAGLSSLTQIRCLKLYSLGASSARMWPLRVHWKWVQASGPCPCTGPMTDLGCLHVWLRGRRDGARSGAAGRFAASAAGGEGQGVPTCGPDAQGDRSGAPGGHSARGRVHDAPHSPLWRHRVQQRSQACRGVMRALLRVYGASLVRCAHARSRSIVDGCGGGLEST